VLEATYYDWKTPIRSIVLKENMNLALIFPDDVRREMTFTLYFFRIARVYPIERVYVLPELRPGDLLSFNKLGEGGFGLGDDIFFMVEDRPFRILHFGIGVYPENVKVWKQHPAGYTVTGWSRRAPSKEGDPIDYFDGHMSPFHEPTRASETVMWVRGSLYLAFRNDEPIAVTPKLRILGAGYDTWIIADKAVADKMVRGAIPCRFITVGGLGEFQYNVPDEWKPHGFTYSLRDVQALARGG